MTGRGVHPGVGAGDGGGSPRVGLPQGAQTAARPRPSRDRSPLALLEQLLVAGAGARPEIIQ